MLKLKSTNKARIIVVSIFLAPVILISGTIHAINFNETLVSLPCFFAYLLAITLGILLFYVSVFYKILMNLFLVFFSLFVYFKGFDLWLRKINTAHTLLA